MGWTYAVTFRIEDKTVAGRSYSERYNDFMDEIRSKGLGFWSDTTSFMFVESEEDTGTFAKRIVRHLSKSNDMVVIFDPSDMSSRYFGKVEYPDTLSSFLPGVQKIE